MYQFESFYQQCWIFRL